MERPTLDNVDLDVLAILARDCRTSYSKIGSLIGLTSKSVKARVKNMVHSGAIKFIVRVNPAAFGYRTVHVSIKTNNAVTRDDAIRRARQFGDLEFHVHQMERIAVAALLVNDSWDRNAIQSLSENLRPATISSTAVSHVPPTADLSETDLRIIKCLLQSGARAEISEIAKELGISEKTTTRRLDRMKEGRLLDFSLQCDPAAMVGYVQFCILIITAKSHYRSVYERMYSEFQDSIVYRPSIIEPDDRLAFVLFGENVFKVDSVLARVDSFEGVKMADAFIVTEAQYYNDWITREIDKRLPMPISRKSRKAAGAFNQQI